MDIKSATIGVVLLVLSCISCGRESGETTPAAHSLRVGDGFDNPIGFYSPQPVFSWKLPVCEGVKAQSAYEIVVASDSTLLPDHPDLWSSQQVDSDCSIRVKYEGKRLDSRQRAYWQVRYWDQNGICSPWSEIAYFELGLLANEDWQGSWICFPFAKKGDTTRFGTRIYEPQYLRREFPLKQDVVSARLYITSRGVFEAHINGAKIGEAIMPPGFTSYSKRIETLTYDVGHLLHKGENTLGVILAPGWYTTRIGWSKSQYVEKGAPKLLCQLEILYDDGHKDVFVSDTSWKATNNGPIRFSEIYDGEIYDQNLEMEDWCKTGFSDSLWANVVAEPVDTSVVLRPKRHTSVKNKKELPARSLSQSSAGVIFDLEQNMVGVPRIMVPMRQGDTLTIRFAEMLQENGELYTANYRTAHSTDYYVAAKDGIIEYMPKFTFHGFRYVELIGYAPDAKPDLSWVTGVVQYSDFEEKGTFISSNEKLNRLHSNIEWGLRGNFFDIPTDCPQRDERMGWTGDAQIFAPTAYLLADVHAFFTAWLESVREDQLPDGRIPIVVPNVAGDRVSPGWGDAITVIPWETYWRTGDVDVLKENFPAMKQWVAFYLKQRKNEIIELDGFGDWLQPFSSLGNQGETPLNLIATAYCAQSLRLTRDAAEVLGYETEYAELDMLYQQLRTAFESYFFDKTGRLLPVETQTGYLMALGFDLLPDDKVRNGAVENLLVQIKKSNNHLGTGFLGTPLLSVVLDRIGRSDLMYDILFQVSYPSWFYSINQGATTIWERWNSYSREEGFGNAGMNSFNHYAYGAVGRWMYERIAGISPLLPGYKKIRIAPYPGKFLTSAKGEYDSPYGRIVSEWSIKRNRLRQYIVIPPNTTAQILIPDNDSMDDVTINGQAVDKNRTMQVIERGANYYCIEVVAGTYDIRSEIK